MLGVELASAGHRRGEEMLFNADQCSDSVHHTRELRQHPAAHELNTKER